MTRYTPLDGWIEGIDQPYFSNRFIFCQPTSTYILAGDRPLIRFAEERRLMGTLRLFCNDKPLEECAHTSMRYRPGMAQWRVSDPAFAGEIVLTVVTADRKPGLVLRVENAPAPLRFTYGGLAYVVPGKSGTQPNWNLEVSLRDRTLTTTVFDEAWLEGNTATLTQTGSVLSAADSERRVHVQTDGALTTEGAFACGSINEYFSVGFAPCDDMPAAFTGGIDYAEALAGRMRVRTPDGYIDSAAAVAVGEMEGAWRYPKTMHGTTSWSMPFVGWLAHIGHPVQGLHERAMATLKAYAAAQNKEDSFTGYAMDATGTLPARDSRFYGKGRITEDQSFYNMQTQFFHQMILAWRFSGDKEFGDILREALRLHCQWQDECFDPDGTGLYISCINTWPTDSVSYADAGAVEETCYAYFARLAMAELCEGTPEETLWLAAAAKIKKAFFEKLWLPQKGYPALYRDKNGFAHDNPWLYAVFLPIECGLLDPFEAAQSLNHALTGYDLDEEGNYWFSDWTPGIWSVRENSGGENMQLTSAFLRGGETAEAVRLLGNATRSYMNSIVPGHMSWPTIETASLFLKIVVMDLFGYMPDYPHSHVTIAPNLPYAWGCASVQTGDLHLEWQRHGVRLHLEKSAAVTLRLRLFADTLTGVRGAEHWRVENGIGGRYVVIELPVCTDADVELLVEGEHDFLPAAEMTALPAGAELLNPQGVNETTCGEHMAFRRQPDGCWQALRLHLGADPVEEENRRKQLTPLPEKAGFIPVDVSAVFNADVAAVFRQQYLSPRPARGCAPQIGYDGHSYWTFPLWDIGAPELALTATGTQVTADGIPYAIANGEANIAFASLWDNHPDMVELPVDEESAAGASMAAVLLCGATSPLFCGVENARLHFVYTDGTDEELPIVNPRNFISLCTYLPRAAQLGLDVVRNDYFNAIDGPLMEGFTSEILPLGENIRALSIRWPIPAGKTLAAVRLSASTRDVIVGLMGVTMVHGS